VLLPLQGIEGSSVELIAAAADADGRAAMYGKGLLMHWLVGWLAGWLVGLLYGCLCHV
jgi:hypothetical protein